MLRKLPVNGFKCVEVISKFDEDFIMKKVTKDIFLELIFITQKVYATFTVIYRYYLKE